MLKLKVQGEPGHIARLTELLESLEDDIEIVNASDLQKWSADAQWADCYIILRLKGEASPMVAPTVKVREKRAKRGAKTKEVDRSGYVYLLKTSGGVYKIGRTNNPYSRRETFKSKLPYEHVNYLRTIRTKDMYKLETELHKRYKAWKVPGTREFFNLTDVQVAEICGIEDEV
jgi:hypothetical protein